jgi:SWI/SNF-related matrix-associated actin-dependent regulator 1 of chromatin subfamily A
MRPIPPSQEVREEALLRAQRLAAGLYPHQVEGLAFLLARRGAILADDMGLGKTRQAIVALREAAPGGPYLVVCPASVKANWKREIEAVVLDAKVWIIGEAEPAGFDGWVVVNYDILGKHVERLQAAGFRGLVFDEAHYLKNHTSQRSKHAQALVRSAAKPVTYLLTGTPLTNRPRDLFPLLQLVGHPLGRSFFTFARRYCDATHNGFGLVTDGASHLDELALQLKGVLLRRTKDEVLDLPPKVRTFLEVEVPEGTAERETTELIQLLIQGTGSAGGRGGSRDAREHLLALFNRVRHTLAKAKVKATVDFVTGAVAQGEKALVFSGYDAPLQALAKKLGDACVVLTGKTPTKARQRLVDRFQTDPSVTVFAANIQAGGVGLNLTAARQVVFNDLDWVPANHWQAEDRAYRIGQMGSVHVAYMVAPNSVDVFVKNVLEVKAALVEAVVEGGALAARAEGTTLDELQRLVRLMSPGLADRGVDRADPEWVRTVLADAAAQVSSEAGASAPRAGAPGGAPSEALVQWLASVLAGPAEVKYRVASGSQAGAFYELLVNGNDVSCSCRGFEFRGTCRHALEVKTCLAERREVPDTYRAVAAG